MTKKHLLPILLMMALLNQGCHPPHDRNRHYLLVIGSVTPDIIEGFEKKFQEGGFPLVQRPTPGIGDISFTVFLPSTNEPPIQATFSAAQVDQQERETAAGQFLSALKKQQGSTGTDRRVLKSLHELLDNVTDSNTDYYILNAGGYIENSGGALSEATRKEDWLNGNFCFSNGQHCMGQDVQAARDQLTDPTSWIHTNIIARNSGNTLLAQKTIHFQSTDTALHKTEGGCSASDVEAFWLDLYNKVNLKPKRYTKGVAAFLMEN